MSPKISVIIPVYNSSETLSQCVESVLSQKYHDFEVLLIDDGSKDDSLSICRRYAETDKRVRVFEKINGGVSSARNIGLDNAEGEWITFVDSDDYLDPLFLEDLGKEDSCLFVKSMKTFRKDKDKRYSVFNFTTEELLKDERLPSFIKENITSFMFRGPCSKFYSRSVIGNLRFLEDMKVAEDTCFVMNYLSRVTKITLLPYGAYVVRLSPSPAKVKYSMSVSYAVQSLGHLYEAYKRVNERFNIGHYEFFSFIGSFKDMAQEDWKERPSKWYNNGEIRSFYKYVWPELSLRQKASLVGAFVLRK